MLEKFSLEWEHLSAMPLKDNSIWEIIALAKRSETGALKGDPKMRLQFN